MSDERRRRLARNLAIALVLAGCSLAQYAAVSRAAPLNVVLAGDSIVEGCEYRPPGHTGGLPAHDARGSTPYRRR
jgi:hypothetical protein